MSDPLAGVLSAISEMRRQIDGMIRHGPVTDVDLSDPTGPRVRIQVGLQSDGVTPSISPWVPYAQVAGAIAAHAPPSVGQQMTLISPAGDFRQGLAVAMSWSTAIPAPSVKPDPAVTYGQNRIDVSPTDMQVTTPGAVTLNAAGLKVTPGTLRTEVGVTGTVAGQGWTLTFRKGLAVIIGN